MRKQYVKFDTLLAGKERLKKIALIIENAKGFSFGEINHFLSQHLGEHGLAKSFIVKSILEKSIKWNISDCDVKKYKGYLAEIDSLVLMHSKNQLMQSTQKTISYDGPMFFSYSIERLKNNFQIYFENDMWQGDHSYSHYLLLEAIVGKNKVTGAFKDFLISNRKGARDYFSQTLGILGRDNSSRYKSRPIEKLLAIGSNETIYKNYLSMIKD